jgi:hypothetical protein
MEIKMETGRALTILVHMAAHNLAATRKLADIVIATQPHFAANQDIGLNAMLAFRKETEKSTQELLQSIWAIEGDVGY